jgi:hypothetical protein
MVQTRLALMLVLAAPQPVLKLSAVDKAHHRETVSVWDTYFSKVHCTRTINLAREAQEAKEPRPKTPQDYHATMCEGPDCVSTSSQEKAELAELESALRARGRETCAAELVTLPEGSAVRIEKKKEQCATMVRIRILDGTYKGRIGCVEPENLSPAPPTQ